MKKLSSSVVKSLLLATLFFSSLNVALADGSRDMFPEGQQGYRAALLGITSANRTVVPFVNGGCLKVYAKAGEYIYAGSSELGKGSAKIVWYAPDGTNGYVSGTSKGLIKDRTQELAGPNYNGTITGGYTPIEFEVSEDQEGVWEFYFIASKPTNTSVTNESDKNFSIEEWVEQSNDGAIMAFDLTVTNSDKTHTIPGRVYTNSLNLITHKNGDDYGPSCYATMYILTNVGYLYKWSLNGFDAHYGGIFSNNKGVQVNGSGTLASSVFAFPTEVATTAGNSFKSYQGGSPSYSSLELVNNENQGFMYDPRLQDNRRDSVDANGDHFYIYEDVTHKIFFCPPAADLPESTAKAVYNGVVDETGTWLRTHKNAEGLPTMSDLTLVGKESGRMGVAGPEGLNIYFNASVAGEFTVKMTFAGYTPRYVNGECV